MHTRIPFWRSLKVRVTLVSLAVFVLGVWSLALYAGRILHRDLQQLLSDQQLSTAAIVAKQVNEEFTERMQALNLVSAQITSGQLGAPRTLQTFLESTPLLQEMFNAGVFVVGTDGTAIASVPAALGRVGVNYSDRDHIANALNRNRTTVSEPVLGRRLNTPVLSIASPIHDAKGNVIGALAGVVNLSQPNFLDLIIGQHYGKSGSYFLVDSQHQVVVTATDKTLNLKPLRAPGVGPIADHFSSGFDGAKIVADAAGAEFLSVAHVVSAAGWHLAISLPLEEAFEPIHALQSGVMGAAAFVTLFAGLLIWWTLRSEMKPLLTTTMALTKMPDTGQFPLALPVVRHDEIGRVVKGFNHLLDSLRSREQALRDSEVQLQEAQSIAQLGSYIVNGADGMWTSSPMLDNLLGIDSTYVRSVQGWADLIHSDDRQRMGEYFAELVESRGPKFDATYQIVRPSDGTTRWMHGLGLLHFSPSGEFLKMNGTIQDVTENRRVQLRLRTLSRITEQAPMAIVIADLKGKIEYVNPYFEKVTGYTFADVVGNNPRILQSGQTAPEVYAEMWAALTDGRAWHGEFQNRKKSGELFVERAVIAPILDSSGVTTHYVALKEDITESKRSQLALETSLREKTALLNEVHHRVKNNLQVITSLLRLEAGRASEPATRSVLGDMQGRIRSMALVHETLYRSGSFEAVDLGSYVHQVATVAFRANTSHCAEVRLILNLLPVRVSLDQATPCGMLVNELISNCLKHAFPDARAGEVHVELHPATYGGISPEHWCLKIWDNGVGLPADFNVRQAQSLGLQLVTDLATQLGGRLETVQDAGACFSVTFPIIAT